MHNNRILYVVTKGDWGGAQKYVQDLALALKEDYEIHVAAGSPGKMMRALQAGGITTHELTSAQRDISITHEWKTLRDLFALIRTLQPDIIHVNSSKMGLAAFAARLCGVRKIIFSPHGWPFLEDRGILATITIAFFSWLTAFLATDVIVISKNDERLARRMPFIKKKTTLIYNGIAEPTRLETPEARQALSKEIDMPLAESDRIIGTIGEYTKNKGHIYLIKAFVTLHKNNLADKLILIGDGELRIAYEALINELGLQDKIILSGFVPNAAQYIPAFNVLTLPSTKEGLPYVLIEAGMLEAPIVASDLGGIKELLTFDGKQHGTLVPPKSVDALAQALAGSLTLPLTPEASLFKKRYSQETMVSKTKKLYA